MTSKQKAEGSTTADKSEVACSVAYKKVAKLWMTNMWDEVKNSIGKESWSTQGDHEGISVFVGNPCYPGTSFDQWNQDNPNERPQADKHHHEEA